MTSVNTNVAAITALRTLQQTNNQLDATQGRISTGLKIGEAKDNAAYWAISTTLKSDNKSLATVKDALGLGSATVDVAYQGLNKTKDVLDEIKAKLTAASQAGVDKNVIQAEIGELQKQLVSIAGSSVFSGENWLSVDSSAVDYDATKKIVASFARDSNNAVSIGTVDVAIGNVALFDSSTVAGKNGILDGMQNLKGSDGKDLMVGGTATSGNTVDGGLKNVTNTGTAATAIAASGLGTDPVPMGATATYTGGGVTLSGTAPTAGDTLTLTFGAAGTAPLILAGTTAPTATQVKTAIDAAITAGTLSGVIATVSGGTNLVLTTTATGAGVTTPIKLTAVTSGGAGTWGAATSVDVPGSAGTGTKAAVTTGTFALTGKGLVAGDVLTFKMNINGSAVEKNVTLTANDISTPATFQASVNTAFTGVADVTGTTTLTFTASAAGLKSSFSLTEVALKDSTGASKVPTSALGLPTATSGKVTTDTFEAFTLDDNDNLYFSITTDTDTAPKMVTINQTLINKTLSTTAAPVTNGSVANVADFKKVVEAALKASNVTNVTVAEASGALSFTSKTAGSTSKVDVSGLTVSGGANQMSIDKIDISDAGLAAANATSGDQIASVLKAYIGIVNNAINSVTTAASNLGAVASRIDMQKSFVNTLMDTIDKGVGGLIDADMSEESTKLQALQVKQSLGVQALSIANQSSQNILRLFQ